MTADEDLRGRIVEFSHEKFFAMGFSKVTMDELSRQLGVSKKTMYKYFPSKDELMDSVAELQMTRVGGKIKEITDGPDDFITKLYTLWQFVGHTVCQISPQFRDDIRRFRPDIWKRIEEMRRKVILGSFSKMLGEGIRLGLVRNDVNKDVMVLMYLSAVQGVVNPETLAQSSFSIEEAFKNIMAVYLDGILTERARKLFHTKLTNHIEARTP